MAFEVLFSLIYTSNVLIGFTVKPSPVERQKGQTTPMLVEKVIFQY